MRVVLDTNVWVSGLVHAKPGGTVDRLLQRVVHFDQICIADDLEGEIMRVFTDRFGWSPPRVASALERSLLNAHHVQLNHDVHVCRDPKDDMFLECSRVADADYLIAGDKDLLVLGSFGRTQIVTPAAYLAVVERA